jgi:hypothetical protein
MLELQLQRHLWGFGVEEKELTCARDKNALNFHFSNELV